jgi:hypothetical protein
MVDVPIVDAIGPESAKALGWTPCETVRVVNWCGYGEERRRFGVQRVV